MTHFGKKVAMFAICFVSAWQASATGEEPDMRGKTQEARKPLVIRADRDADWGASLADVEAVLNSAAETMWPNFPERTLEPILVKPRGGPIVLFKRGSKGEYRVHLSTGETYWSQYAFQFAHEFCHILCNYDEDVHRNKWFEESLCETASLFALRQMSETWKTKPPYPNWRGYAPALRKYAEERLEQAKLPKETTFAMWFSEHEAKLYGNATDRSLNLVVASQLLPLLEEDPGRWEAVTWLNAAKSRQSQTFVDYLSQWQQQSPQGHREFIRTIGSKFGQKLNGSDKPDLSR